MSQADKISTFDGRDTFNLRSRVAYSFREIKTDDIVLIESMVHRFETGVVKGSPKKVKPITQWSEYRTRLTLDSIALLHRGADDNGMADDMPDLTF